MHTATRRRRPPLPEASRARAASTYMVETAKRVNGCAVAFLRPPDWDAMPGSPPETGRHALPAEAARAGSVAQIGTVIAEVATERARTKDAAMVGLSEDYDVHRVRGGTVAPHEENAHDSPVAVANRDAAPNVCWPNALDNARSERHTTPPRDDSHAVTGLRCGAPTSPRDGCHALLGCRSEKGRDALPAEAARAGNELRNGTDIVQAATECAPSKDAAMVGLSEDYDKQHNWGGTAALHQTNADDNPAAAAKRYMAGTAPTRRLSGALDTVPAREARDPPVTTVMPTLGCAAAPLPPSEKGRHASPGCPPEKGRHALPAEAAWTGSVAPADDPSRPGIPHAGAGGPSKRGVRETA